MANWWNEPDFQKNLLRLICRDRNFLKHCGSLLKPSDFKPGRDETKERLILATLALEYWEKHRAPIGGMLRAWVAIHIQKNNVANKTKKKITKLVDEIQNGEQLVAVESVEELVINYLKDKKIQDSIESLIEKQEAGELDTDTFVEICKEVIEWSGKPKRIITSYLDKSQLENRIARRNLSTKDKRPLLFLPGFDERSPAIGRGDLGLFIAPYKKGKSLGLAHIADGYAKQGLNVLYITLEDPKDEVEDRMDAALAYMPINKLNQLPNRLRKRFRKFGKRISGHIRIVDSTEDDLTVANIEEMWETLRDQGWVADAIIVDYDDEIKAPKVHKGESHRRFEFADIYRALRKMAARTSTIVWTAAQTRKLADTVRVISADKVAEDSSKIRKSTLVIGIGQGKTNTDARYIYVAAAKRGPSRFGFEIISNPGRGLFYDEELTETLVRRKRKKVG